MSSLNTLLRIGFPCSLEGYVVDPASNSDESDVDQGGPIRNVMDVLSPSLFSPRKSQAKLNSSSLGESKPAVAHHQYEGMGEENSPPADERAESGANPADDAALDGSYLDIIGYINEFETPNILVRQATEDEDKARLRDNSASLAADRRIHSEPHSIPELELKESPPTYHERQSESTAPQELSFLSHTQSAPACSDDLGASRLLRSRKSRQSHMSAHSAQSSRRSSSRTLLSTSANQTAL